MPLARINSLLAVAALSASAGAQTARPASVLPAPVTLAGVGGIQIGMGSKQVARLIGAPTVAVASGTSGWLYVPICIGAMHGTAGFFGPDSNLEDQASNSLEWIWFSAGAKTRRHVGTGSSRAAVIRAYGPQLHHDGNHGLYLVGKPVEIFPQTLVKPVIYFLFDDRGHVSDLGYGARQQVLTGELVTIFCR